MWMTNWVSSSIPRWDFRASQRALRVWNWKSNSFLLTDLRVRISDTLRVAGTALALSLLVDPAWSWTIPLTKSLDTRPSSSDLRKPVSMATTMKSLRSSRPNWVQAFRTFSSSCSAIHLMRCLPGFLRGSLGTALIHPCSAAVLSILEMWDTLRLTVEPELPSSSHSSMASRTIAGVISVSSV
jgi:hypothetical protein